MRIGLIEKSYLLSFIVNQIEYSIDLRLYLIVRLRLGVYGEKNLLVAELVSHNVLYL